MIIHTAIRNFVINALKETVTEASFFDGRPAVLEVADLPAVAVYLTDVAKAENYLDGDQWSAVLHIEVFSAAQDPDSVFDEWVEREIYPAMQHIPALMNLVESLTPIGYEYRRDEDLATWGSADLMYLVTYIR